MACVEVGTIWLRSALFNTGILNLFENLLNRCGDTEGRHRSGYALTSAEGSIHSLLLEILLKTTTKHNQVLIWQSLHVKKPWVVWLWRHQAIIAYSQLWQDQPISVSWYFCCCCFHVVCWSTYLRCYETVLTSYTREPKGGSPVQPDLRCGGMSTIKMCRFQFQNSPTEAAFAIY